MWHVIPCFIWDNLRILDLASKKQRDNDYTLLAANHYYVELEDAYLVQGWPDIISKELEHISKHWAIVA